jgi:PKHD-type hydroxylase
VIARETPAIKPKDLPRLKDWKPAVASEGIFNSEECNGIIALRDEMEPGQVTGGGEAQSHRKCMVSWIEPTTPGSGWVFEKASHLIAQVNDSLYQLDLFGFTERLQFTVYETGHFAHWHLDLGPDRYSIRKLAFTIQLSDPADYEGGEFEILTFHEPFTLPKTRGTMIVFPAYVLHRVKPITAGVRMSLIGWIGGPHYR